MVVVRVPSLLDSLVSPPGPRGLPGNYLDRLGEDFYYSVVGIDSSPDSNSQSVDRTKSGPQQFLPMPINDYPKKKERKRNLLFYFRSCFNNLFSVPDLDLFTSGEWTDGKVR